MTHTILSTRRSLSGALTRYSFRITAAGLTLALAAAMAQAKTSGDSRPASPSTLEFNKNSTASLPWSDKADFANAKRGLIARLPDNGVIKDANGGIVWDLLKFTGFIKDGSAAPDTVIILAGDPQDQVESHKQSGVNEFIHIRADVLEVLSKLHSRLGIQ